MTPTNTFTLTSGNDAAAGRAINVALFGEVPYEQAYQAMSDFANRRSSQDNDQIWLIQHPQVYTQGTACDSGALLPSQIPTVKTDRGGQITYHGPGQIVMYPMLNLKQYGMGVKSFVARLEQCVIDLLSDFEINAKRRSDAPGVYVNDAKIAALGLRIRRGTSYHGLSFNFDMDLTPFSNIDPCGYKGLSVTQLSDQMDASEFSKLNIDDVGEDVLRRFVKSL